MAFIAVHLILFCFVFFFFNILSCTFCVWPKITYIFNECCTCNTEQSAVVIFVRKAFGNATADADEANCALMHLINAFPCCLHSLVVTHTQHSTAHMHLTHSECSTLCAMRNVYAFKNKNRYISLCTHKMFRNASERDSRPEKAVHHFWPNE